MNYPHPALRAKCKPVTSIDAGVRAAAGRMLELMYQAEGLGLADAAGPLEAIGAQVWGPAPAPVARIRGRHRMRLLVKAPKGAPLQPALRAWLAPVRLTGDLRLVVDIDPQSFM